MMTSCIALYVTDAGSTIRKEMAIRRIRYFIIITL